MSEEANPTESQPPVAEPELVNVSEYTGKFVASISARLAIAFLIFLTFVLGCFVAGTGLHDPDTCWLLALGRYMFEHGALPMTDPFSYTFADLNRHFVQYQWLSELIFFAAYRLGGLVGLLMFAALTIGMAFLVLPMRTAAKYAPLVVSIKLSVVGLVAACFHFLVRPEIISYLLLGLLFVIFSRILDQSSKKIDLPIVAASFLLFLVWANAHTAFMLGLVFLFALVLSLAVDLFVWKRDDRANLLTAFSALLASIAATFVNPRGFELWSYLPGLYFAPFNHRIAELAPLKLSAFKEWTYYPFLFLVIAVLVILFRALVKAAKTKSYISLFDVAMIIAAVIYSFCTLRMIPFAVLSLIFCGSRLYRVGFPPVNEDGNYNFWNDLDVKLEKVCDPRSSIWPVTVAGLTLFGAFFTTAKIATPRLPQSSDAMPMPTEALAWIQQNSPRGHMFNDAQYGDILIFHQPEIPVFIDTRYDMYGENLISDYITISSASPGWRELLDKYDVQWVFVPQKAKIAKRLSDESRWQVVFSDKKSVVISRRHP